LRHNHIEGMDILHLHEYFQHEALNCMLTLGLKLRWNEKFD